MVSVSLASSIVIATLIIQMYSDLHKYKVKNMCSSAHSQNNSFNLEHLKVTSLLRQVTHI